MRDAHISAETNVIAAGALAVADHLLERVSSCWPSAQQHAAVLAVLTQDPEGTTIRWVAQSLGVSRSRAVRIADDLEADGLARRVASSVDRREVRLSLTREGRAAADELQHTRAAVMSELLAELSANEVTRFAELSAKLLRSAATTHERAQAICRLCDADVCGHHAGRCPVTAAADAREAAA